MIESDDPDGEPELKYNIPFFENFNNDSVFDLCVKKNNYVALNMHLDYLKHYSVDHHSRLLARVFPELIEARLSNLIPYIESRS
jgi:hypothetical protein